MPVMNSSTARFGHFTAAAGVGSISLGTGTPPSQQENRLEGKAKAERGEMKRETKEMGNKEIKNPEDKAHPRQPESVTAVVARWQNPLARGGGCCWGHGSRFMQGHV